MDSIFVYPVNLPSGIHEMITPCIDGYTVYINQKDSVIRQRESLRHAISHIERHDFEKADVGQIEYEAHRNQSGVSL